MNEAAGSAVTPMVITYDEEPNIARMLDSLRWARRVVVLDSGSTDATRAIAERYPNVAFFTRPFDDFKTQTDHGIQATGIDTDYVLALDADMAVPPAFVAELEQHFLGKGYAGALVPFEYWVLGRPLLGSLYPSMYRLFRPSAGRVIQVGHGHKFEVDGPTYRFRARLRHDDRKSLDWWTRSQIRLLEEGARADGGGGRVVAQGPAPAGRRDAAARGRVRVRAERGAAPGAGGAPLRVRAGDVRVPARDAGAGGGGGAAGLKALESPILQSPGRPLRSSARACAIGP